MSFLSLISVSLVGDKSEILSVKFDGNKFIFFWNFTFGTFVEEKNYERLYWWIHFEADNMKRKRVRQRIRVGSIKRSYKVESE